MGQPKKLCGAARVAEIRARVEQCNAKKDGFVRIPRSFLTDVMALLTGPELKAALTVYAATIGFDRDRKGDISYPIPWRRFQSLGGLSRTTAYHAIEGIVESGIVTAEQQHDAAGDLTASRYAPTILAEYEGVVPRSELPSSTDGTTGSSAIGTGVVPPVEPLTEYRSEKSYTDNLNRHTDLDSRHANRKNGESQPAKDDCDFPLLRNEIDCYCNELGMDPHRPPADFVSELVWKCREVVHGATEHEVVKCVAYYRETLTSGHRNAPNSWQWFLTAIPKRLIDEVARDQVIHG